MESIGEDGNIHRISIKDNKIYVDNVFIDNIDKWNDHKFFILHTPNTDNFDDTILYLR